MSIRPRPRTTPKYCHHDHLQRLATKVGERCGLRRVDLSATAREFIGAVAIGRNEGERLRRCLEALFRDLDTVVYVDSGSTDDSVSLAQSFGAAVVELDTTTPFTAARARNAGFEKLSEIRPGLDFVYFSDGDCEIAPGWIDAAYGAIVENDRAAAVWGRLRERHPERSVYNRLCDIEWRYNWQCGEVRLFGGNVLLRAEAFQSAKGFDETLIAGEEPELSFRLRKAGWIILRIDADMAAHDAAMTRFGQWRTRVTRSGYADAERHWRYRRDPDQYWRPLVRTAFFWGFFLPVVSVGLAGFSGGTTLLLLLAYPVSWVRAYRWPRRQGAPAGDSAVFASFAVLSKFPHVWGQFKYWVDRVLGRRRALIEYK